MDKINLILLLLLNPIAAQANNAYWITYSDPGHAVWLVVAGILILFMALPGIAIFYGGLVRSKNVLSIIAQCFFILAVTTLMWVIVGYSLSFSDGGKLQSLIGGLQFSFLSQLTSGNLSYRNAPEVAFLLYQMGFAILTPALIIGGFAERMRFDSAMIFIILWELFAYYPICHWVWGGGWLMGLGAMDFAGGTVVHVNSGIAGLVAAYMVGKRTFGTEEQPPPHDIVLVTIGAGILWIGWFGFNGGGASSFHQLGIALLNTQIAMASGIFFRTILEFMIGKKHSVLSSISGAISGLVAITSAAGYVNPTSALLLGGVASIVCYFAIQFKKYIGLDDALDTFGLHGIAGIFGALLTGILAASLFGGVGLTNSRTILEQFNVQLICVITVCVWSALVTFIILKVLDKTIGLRVQLESEATGLDIAAHGEHGYN